ncbi:T9SS type B sorting domain-containing protein [Flavobacterium rivuli]|uniref:T9SS type B sorting domain-containing protein n=1 Tax=Flavobacterium rivuli TaxID=498301 RepID=UPI00036A638A|nr:T9SS type B sorting domain-containing protein [Flavobacterium rivuli]
MKNFISLLFVLFLSFTASAQYATNHYIAPSPWQYWSDANEVVISTTSAGTVSVTLKKSNGTVITTLSVTAANPVSYRFVGNPVNVPANTLNTITSDRGLIVEASAPVLVNLRNIASDAPGTNTSNIKGNASLVSFGNEGIGLAFRLGYYRSSYTGISSGAPVYSVMAIENGTIVRLNGTVMAILNAGQSRLFTAAMGSLLTSDKPVVANTGTYGDTPQSCNGNGEDATVDQIAPVNKLGMQYMLVRGNGTPGTDANNPEQSTIIASEDNTSITIINYDADGNEINTSTQVLATAGSYITIHHGDAQTMYSSTFVNALKPVVVYSATAVNCETDVSTVLPIGGCAGSTNIITRKFISYNSTDLPYFGYTILESATEPVFINGLNLETVTGVSRTPIGSTGFYMLRFTDLDIGSPTVIGITSNARLTTSIIQQGDGFSMSGFFSAFSDTPEPPAEVTSSDTCTVTLSTTIGLAPYQWYLEGVAIAGADAPTYVATQTGNYTVVASRDCGITAPSAPVFITVNPCSDLKVEKSVISITGNQAVFQITASNVGSVNDTNVQVSDLLPSGYQFVSATTSAGTYTAATGVWAIGNLNATTSQTLTVTATINATGNFVNIAAITGTNTDTNTANNTAQATAQITNFTLSKRPEYDQYYNVGDVIRYNLQFFNVGQTTLTNIVVSDTNADAGSISPATIASVASGEVVNITALHTITMQDALAGRVVNQAFVSVQNDLGATLTAVSDDTHTPTINDATITPIIFAADLLVVKTNNQTVYVPGTNTVYTISVTNNGPGTATNVSVSDPLPAGITTMSWSGNGATGTGSLNNVVASIAVGATVTYQVTVAVPQSFTGNLINTVAVTGNQPDPDPVCTQCTDIDTECALQITAPTPLSECDDTVPDGFKILNLTGKTAEIIGQNTGLTVSYYLNNTNLANGTAIATPDNFRNTIAYTQTIIAEVTDAGGCKTYVNLQIEIAKSPEPVLILQKTICQDNSNLYNLTVYEQEILNGETGTRITGYFTSDTNAENNVNALQNPAGFTLMPNLQTIFIRVENTTGCFTIAKLQLTILPAMAVNLQGKYTICYDANGNILSPAVIDTGLSAALYTFKWYRNGQLLNNTDPAISVSQTGNYTVEVSNASGCPPGTATTVVSLSNGPENFTAQVVTGYFSNNATIFAQATGGSNLVYWMDNGPEQQSNYFYNVERGTHLVHVKDAGGCGAVYTVQVVVIDYPKYFTPNGDSTNEYWNIRDLRNQPNAMIYIFDRYGKLITSVKPSGTGWDGTLNGHPLPATDYWFTLFYREGATDKEFNAHFSLIR